MRWGGGCGGRRPAGSWWSWLCCRLLFIAELAGSSAWCLQTGSSHLLLSLSLSLSLSQIGRAHVSTLHSLCTSHSPALLCCRVFFFAERGGITAWCVQTGSPPLLLSLSLSLSLS